MTFCPLTVGNVTSDGSHTAPGTPGTPPPERTVQTRWAIRASLDDVYAKSSNSTSTVTTGACAPDRRAVSLDGHLVPRRVGRAVGERVVVGLGDRAPVGAVEAQLQVAGVRARRERAGARGEADLQVAVGGRRRGGQRPERAGDVGAAQHRPRAGEPVTAVRRVAAEVVPTRD